MNIKDVNKKYLKELSDYQKKVFNELLKELKSNNGKARTFETANYSYMTINGTTAVKTAKEYSYIDTTKNNTSTLKPLFEFNYEPITLSLITRGEQEFFTNKKLLKEDGLYIFNPTLVNMFGGEHLISDRDTPCLMIRNPIYTAIVLPIITSDIACLNNIKE